MDTLLRDIQDLCRSQSILCWNRQQLERFGVGGGLSGSACGGSMTVSLRHGVGGVGVVCGDVVGSRIAVGGVGYLVNVAGS